MSTKVRESSPNGLTLSELMEVWQTKPASKPTTDENRPVLISLVSDNDNWVRDAKVIGDLPQIVYLECQDYAPPNSWSIYLEWSDGDRTRLEFTQPSGLSYNDPLQKGVTFRINVIS